MGGDAFPYIWFDSYEKMNATLLPGREHFNQHTDQQKNDEDYDYATKAWEKLKCKTFEDYHDKYLLADVGLLATCFHAFRRNIYKMHVTDPAYFVDLPGLSWSLVLKHQLKGKPIELLEKPEHYIEFQNNIQGGITQVFQRYAKRKYNTSGQSLSQIMYFDVNGLYVHIMANYKLPYKLVEHNVYGEYTNKYTYEKIKELSEDEEHTYFFIIDASISESMIID